MEPDMLVNEHPATTQKERDLRVLEDFLDSDGWELLCQRIILPNIAKAMQLTFDYSLRGEHDRAAKESSYGSALIELVSVVYQKAERTIPDYIKRLKKGHVHEYDGDSADRNPG
jgi:hypothetical protein